MHTSSALRGSLFLFGLAAILLPNTSLLTAQPGNKDDIIKRLQEKIERREQDIEHLEKVVQDREAVIKRLQAEARQYRKPDFTFIIRVRLQLEKLSDELREVKARSAAFDRDEIVFPIVLNPPPVKADGKIEKIDGDLVQISLGTDHGIKKDHTLDVYRIEPEPKYLGRIRVVDANHQKSVARLEPWDGPVPRSALRVGDFVTSKLTKDDEPKEK